MADSHVLKRTAALCPPLHDKKGKMCIVCVSDFRLFWVIEKKEYHRKLSELNVTDSILSVDSNKCLK